VSYATDKVIYHPRLVQAFKTHCSHELFPVFIHLMPQNFCNQNCHFCSYRMDNWKNSKHFDASSSLPWDRMKDLICEIDYMGVKAIELTGGGEPLAYPHIDKLLEELQEHPIEMALVTNGTLLKEATADLLYSTKLQWARVSVDAGNKEDYCRIRCCPESHWTMAWKGIERLVERRKNQAIGIGFVITDENYKGLQDCCLRAKDVGVDNVRVSVAFTPKGADILDVDAKREVRQQLDELQSLNDMHFQVVDLFEERLSNLRFSSKQQDYDYCGTKDLLCVITGDGSVYTCCTLTGTLPGLIGNITELPLDKLWQQMAVWRKDFDPRKKCKCTCLYEKRNQVMLDLRNPPDHLNFI